MDFTNFVFSHLHVGNSNTAVIDSDGEAYSYTELLQEIILAEEQINRAGIAAHEMLIIHLDKSFKSLAYLLACLKQNIVYVPIDIDSPKERVENIVRQSKANAILHPDFQITRLSKQRTTIPSDACCVLYTSGSTGIPKGVICSKTGLHAFIDWTIREFNIEEQDRLSAFAPFHFDLSTLDIFAGLAAGASIWLIDKKLGGNIRLVGSQLATVNPTIMYATPTTFRLLHQYGKLPEGFEPRLTLFAGEVFPIDALNSLRKQWSNSLYYNLYGPTETNVCTFFQLPKHIETSRKKPYPIGQPCPYASIELGENNELLVSGTTLMLGYHNNPEETSMKLITSSGVQYYKTGDQAEFEHETLYYVGRLDRMVKRKGFRIELGEIERAFGGHQNITSCAAIAIPHHQEMSIVLFYTGGKISSIDLSIFGATNLLDYMLPDYYRHISELPINSHGKVDYKQLITNFNTNE